MIQITAQDVSNYARSASNKSLKVTSADIRINITGNISKMLRKSPTARRTKICLRLNQDQVVSSKTYMMELF